MDATVLPCVRTAASTAPCVYCGTPREALWQVHPPQDSCHGGVCHTCAQRWVSELSPAHRSVECCHACAGAIAPDALLALSAAVLPSPLAAMLDCALLALHAHSATTVTVPLAVDHADAAGCTACGALLLVRRPMNPLLGDAARYLHDALAAKRAAAARTVPFMLAAAAKEVVCCNGTAVAAALAADVAALADDAQRQEAAAADAVLAALARLRMAIMADDGADCRGDFFTPDCPACGTRCCLCSACGAHVHAAMPPPCGHARLPPNTTLLAWRPPVALVRQHDAVGGLPLARLPPPCGPSLQALVRAAPLGAVARGTLAAVMRTHEAARILNVLLRGISSGAASASGVLAVAVDMTAPRPHAHTDAACMCCGGGGNTYAVHAPRAACSGRTCALCWGAMMYHRRLAYCAACVTPLSYMRTLLLEADASPPARTATSLHDLVASWAGGFTTTTLEDTNVTCACGATPVLCVPPRDAADADAAYQVMVLPAVRQLEMATVDAMYRGTDDILCEARAAAAAAHARWRRRVVRPYAAALAAANADGGVACSHCGARRQLCVTCGTHHHADCCAAGADGGAGAGTEADAVVVVAFVRVVLTSA